ncbi:MAG: GNAT family N-acetyltransferase [Hyphomicrobiales bacterium]
MTIERPPVPPELTVISGAGLRIHRKHLTDAVDDYRWRRDLGLLRFDGGPPVTESFSDFLQHFEQGLRFISGERRAYAIDTEDGLHVGNIMYYNADLARTAAELGVSIGHPEARGRGLGTAAVVLFLRYLWSTYTFRRIYLHTFEWNERARRCFERAGFDTVSQVVRGGATFVRMETRREWWTLWDQEGRFEPILARAANPATTRRPDPEPGPTEAG